MKPSTTTARAPAPRILAVVYLLLWLWAAWAPVSRQTWLLENLLVFAFVGLLAATHRRFVFSKLSYALIFVVLSLHTVGSHYTYAEAPIGFWVSDLFGIERNHYDRAVHFSFGLLLCYPLHELIQRSARPAGNWSLVFAVLVVCTFSLIYETIEWIVAVIVSPEASMAFLGTQGDVFDAQKDGALAALGSVIAASIALAYRKSRKQAG